MTFESELNCQMAERCQARMASCCTKGLIFLPDDELGRLIAWIDAESPVDKVAFSARLTRHEGFALYDQQQRCQFLTDGNLCRLHTEGVKPAECFWWPLHVYVNPDGELEARVSTSCCTAHELIQSDSPVVAEIRARVVALGSDIICRFRSVYIGSYDNKLVAKIDAQAHET